MTTKTESLKFQDIRYKKYPLKTILEMPILGNMQPAPDELNYLHEFYGEDDSYQDIDTFFVIVSSEENLTIRLAGGITTQYIFNNASYYNIFLKEFAQIVFYHHFKTEADILKWRRERIGDSPMYDSELLHVYGEIRKDDDLLVA